MRNKFLGILNLVVMLFYLVRPSLPYIEYVLHKDYIEKNLCVQKENPCNSCHGKCYLHEKLKKQNETSDANTGDKNKPIPENKMDDHVKSSQDMPFIFGHKIISARCYFINKTNSVTSDIFVPPRF